MTTNVWKSYTKRGFCDICHREPIEVFEHPGQPHLCADCIPKWEAHVERAASENELWSKYLQFRREAGRETFFGDTARADRAKAKFIEDFKSGKNYILKKSFEEWLKTTDPDIRRNPPPPPRGKLVDVMQRSPDAPFILEGDEEDLDWYEVRVPLKHLPVIADVDRKKSEQFEGMSRRTIAAILEESPPLYFFGSQGWKLLDGAHRLNAARRAGIEIVPVLFAISEDL
jgi:hypothetical protein